MAYYTIYAYLVLTLTNLFKGGIGLCGVGGVSPGGALVSGSPGLVGLVGGVAGGGKPLQGSAFLVLLISCSSYKLHYKYYQERPLDISTAFLACSAYPTPAPLIGRKVRKSPLE
ncbi:hypothetical protein [Desulfitobacterium hafniense]|uniref:hypothetical protein n=1 Tax=Desulfitobacterium hafniense TaxID=49338 RepID=UPI001FA72543|nr:hypothetical protein [Desulfitobacterium hafniense]